MRSHLDTQRAPMSPRRPNGRARLFTLAGLIVALGAAGLGATAQAAPLGPARHSVEVIPGRWIEVRGERNHQQRLARRLPATWSTDQKTAAARYGYPFFRLRELSAGVTTEVWTYPDRDLQLVFDASGRLIDSRLP